MPKFTAEELKNKTPEELAILGERNHQLSAEGILIKEEFERRRSEGRSTALPKNPWHETFIGKVIVGVIVGIALLFVTLFITRYVISKSQKPPMPQQEQQRNIR